MPVREGGAEEKVKSIRRQVKGSERRFRKAFLRMVSDMVDSHTLTELEDLIASNSVETAFAVLDNHIDNFSSQYTKTFINSGEQAAKFLSEDALTTVVEFDAINTRAVAAMQLNRLNLIREMRQDQRNVIRKVLTEGIVEGANPRETAKKLRGVFGLTERQDAACNNFRRLLSSEAGGTPSEEIFTRRLRGFTHDRAVRRAIQSRILHDRAVEVRELQIATGSKKRTRIPKYKPLSEEQINKMSDRYRERYLQYRAEVIARTESLRAVHQGKNEMYLQAVDAGHMERGQILQKWNTALDQRVRDTPHTFGSTVTRDGGASGKRLMAFYAIPAIHQPRPRNQFSAGAL